MGTVEPMNRSLAVNSVSVEGLVYDLVCYFYFSGHLRYFFRSFLMLVQNPVLV